MSFTHKEYFDSMPSYVMVIDHDLKVMDANKKFIDDFGHFEGRYCYQVFKNSPTKCESCAVEKTFKDKRGHKTNCSVKTLDGREIDVQINTNPILDEDGKISSVMESAIDISELMECQKLMKDNKDRYMSIFEEVPCFISIQDRDLNIVNSNRLFKETFGCFLGCKCYEVYKHRKEECFPCTVRETFEDGKIHSREEIVTSRDGKTMNCIVHTAPIKDINGNIIKVIEMSTDITELRALQDQLSSIGMLISSISHGIKGLLNGLNGGIYLVNKGIENDNKARLEQGWEIVLRNVGRIRSMVMDILYYAKDREPNWQDIDSSDLVKEICELMKSKASELGVDFTCAADTDILNFDGDRNAIRALLINLIENSLDACRVDKKKSFHSVLFKVNTNEENIYFTIEDNGIGMDQETKEKAFSLFFSSKGSEGTGLGLFIANKIINSHGGRIQIESEQYKGSKFTVIMPRRCVDLSAKDFK